jgi:hypothetical protein
MRFLGLKDFPERISYIAREPRGCLSRRSRCGLIDNGCGCISGKVFGLFYLILNTFIADDGGIEAAFPPAKKFSLTN